MMILNVACIVVFLCILSSFSRFSAYPCVLCWQLYIFDIFGQLVDIFGLVWLCCSVWTLVWICFFDSLFANVHHFAFWTLYLVWNWHWTGFSFISLQSVKFGLCAFVWTLYLVWNFEMGNLFFWHILWLKIYAVCLIFWICAIHIFCKHISLSLFVNQEHSCDLQRGWITDSGQSLLMMSLFYD